MALEEYTLSTIRDETLDEFGLDTADATLKTKGNSIINLAQAFITMSRPDWPWRMQDLALDVSPSTQGTADLTQDSPTLANVTISPSLAKLDIVSAGADLQRPLLGYVVSSTPTVLTSNYRGTTEAGASITRSTGFLALPSDFSRLKVARMIQDSAEPRFVYRTPLELKEMKFKARQIDLNHQFYTVIPDPLFADVGASSVTYYLEFYPYITDRSLIAGSYWRDTPKLDADTEVPLIPRQFRSVLLLGSQWFLGRHLKVGEERLKEYRMNFYSLLGGMREFYNLSADPGPEPDRIGDSPVDWVMPPPGYPDFGAQNLVV